MKISNQSRPFVQPSVAGRRPGYARRAGYVAFTTTRKVAGDAKMQTVVEPKKDPLGLRFWYLLEKIAIFTPHAFYGWVSEQPIRQKFGLGIVATSTALIAFHDVIQTTAGKTLYHTFFESGFGGYLAFGYAATMAGAILLANYFPKRDFRAPLDDMARQMATRPAMTPLPVQSASYNARLDEIEIGNPHTRAVDWADQSFVGRRWAGLLTAGIGLTLVYVATGYSFGPWLTRELTRGSLEMMGHEIKFGLGPALFAAAVSFMVPFIRSGLQTRAAADPDTGRIPSSYRTIFQNIMETPARALAYTIGFGGAALAAGAVACFAANPLIAAAGGMFALFAAHNVMAVFNARRNETGNPPMLNPIDKFFKFVRHHPGWGSAAFFLTMHTLGQVLFRSSDFGEALSTLAVHNGFVAAILGYGILSITQFLRAIFPISDRTFISTQFFGFLPVKVPAFFLERILRIPRDQAPYVYGVSPPEDQRPRTHIPRRGETWWGKFYNIGDRNADFATRLTTATVILTVLRFTLPHAWNLFLLDPTGISTSLLFLGLSLAPFAQAGRLDSGKPTFRPHGGNRWHARWITYKPQYQVVLKPNQRLDPNDEEFYG